MTKAPSRSGPFASLRWSLPLALLVLTAPAHADELRLHDGRVIVGKVAVKGDAYEVTTRDGIVTVPKDQVEVLKPEADLRRALAERSRSAGDSTFAHLQLAIDARAVGLEPEMWQHLDRAMARFPDVGEEAAPGLQRRCAEFLAQLEPELLPRRHRTAPTTVRVHQLLEALKSDSSPARAAAVEELLVRENNADQDLRKEARGNNSQKRRIGALGALQRRALAGNDRFVLRTAVLDSATDVRTAAIELVRPMVKDEDINYLATGLAAQTAKVRVRTAEALGELGNPAAIKLLVMAAPNAGKALAGGSGEIRNHIAIIQQQAYIRDFNVEVAAASFIADPQIDVLTSGSVLDVSLLAVTEVRTILQSYRRSLTKLAKSDPGDNPGTWPTWLAQLPTAAAQTPATTGAR